MIRLVTAILCACAFLAPRVHAAENDVEFGGATYRLWAHRSAHRAKEPTFSFYIPINDSPESPKTAIEMVHFGKAKYPDQVAQTWLPSVVTRSVEKPTVHPSPTDKEDLIYEVMTFFSNPAGQEVMLNRFFREPGGGVTSYLVKWRFLEVEGVVDDSSYRSRLEKLIEELRHLKLPLNPPPPPAPPAAKPEATPAPAPAPDHS
jgi:hypothetical protein